MHLQLNRPTRWAHGLVRLRERRATWGLCIRVGTLPTSRTAASSATISGVRPVAYSGTWSRIHRSNTRAAISHPEREPWSSTNNKNLRSMPAEKPICPNCEKAATLAGELIAMIAPWWAVNVPESENDHTCTRCGHTVHLERGSEWLGLRWQTSSPPTTKRKSPSLAGCARFFGRTPKRWEAKPSHPRFVRLRPYD